MQTSRSPANATMVLIFPAREVGAAKVMRLALEA